METYRYKRVVEPLLLLHLSFNFTGGLWALESFCKRIIRSLSHWLGLLYLLLFITLYLYFTALFHVLTFSSAVSSKIKAWPLAKTLYIASLNFDPYFYRLFFLQTIKHRPVEVLHRRYCSTLNMSYAPTQKLVTVKSSSTANPQSLRAPSVTRRHSKTVSTVRGRAWSDAEVRNSSDFVFSGVR